MRTSRRRGSMWFKTFDIVLNALDNLDARRHVNKMCMAANVPLVESGTAGYFGQVQPIVKDQTECFDCLPKPTPKTFPVCTIRSTPSQPIHCIVWAKSYLFPQLFGEDEDDQGELDEAERSGENATEIQNLRREAQTFKSVRALIRSSHSQGQDQSEADAPRRVFEKVFMQDVKNLLSMTDMWKSRAAPVPLEFESIMAVPNGDSVIPGDGNAPANADSNVNGNVGANANGHATRTSMGLKDQKSLTLRETVEMFVSSFIIVVVGTGVARICLCFSPVYSTNRLSSRLSRPKEEGGEEMISFDKDDDDTLDFVCAAANLRSIVYGIGGKTRWEVKEMAGNIIPAIATTNAIIAGLIVLQALHLLRAHQPSTSTSTLSASAPSATTPTTTSTSKSPNPSLRTIHLQHKPAVPLQPTRPEPPNRTCGVCRDTYLDVRCDPGRTTLAEVVNLALKRGIERDHDENVEVEEDEDEFGGRYEPPDAEVSVYEDKRILADPDFDDNWGRTLEDLGCGRGKFITIVDEEGEGEGEGGGDGGGGGWGTLAVAVGLLPDDHPADGPAVLLIEPVRRAQRRTNTEGKAGARPSTPTIGSKRPAESGDHDRDRAKRPRTDAQAVPMSSPSKGYKEVDGVVIIEDDVDDVIVIDD
ncbi:hypothetical protein BU17DRAFT_61027 [Hysterangium stoloniferum]|nr:hypothetical protein BU17DRAFT_61027 [Hysterangium stoloniferum]